MVFQFGANNLFFLFFISLPYLIFMLPLQKFKATFQFVILSDLIPVLLITIYLFEIIYKIKILF